MSDESSFAIGVPGLEPEAKKGTSLAAAFLHICAGVAGFIVPATFLPYSPHGGGRLTACKSNCKNIATALEMYSTDNKGRYPTNLAKLTAGNYLKVIPTCPAAGKVTYLYRSSSEPDSFRFACAGNNHAKAYSGFSSSSNNFPRYNAEEGLIDHP